MVRRTGSRGLALLTVLMLSAIVLVISLSVLGLSSNSILFVSAYHKRTAARYAAEGGVYRAIDRLEGNASFNGRFEETLPHTEASFQADVENQLGDEDASAAITSVGRAGAQRKRLKVEVRLSADAYAALASEGRLQFSGNTFINGIRSIGNPVPEPGNVHTNSSDWDAIGGDGHVDVSGKASSMGSVGTVIDLEDRLEYANRAPLKPVDRDRLLAVSFPDATLPYDGVIRRNTRIGGNLQVEGDLVVEKGCVMHVQGDLRVGGTIRGGGTVVVDGDTVFHGSSGVDLANTDGVLLYGGGDISLGHPLQVFRDGEFSRHQDAVAEYFGRMPDSAPNVLSRDLPEGTPTGIAFFEWYARQSRNPSEEFLQWRDGSVAGSEGIPTEVRLWLDSSTSILEDLRKWQKGQS